MSDETLVKLSDLKAGVDRIESKLDSQAEWMRNHAVEDAAMAKSIEILAARPRGFARIGATLSAMLIAIGLFPRPH